MSESVVVGIDGGATRSFAVSVNTAGELLALSKAGSLNYCVAGLAEARRTLKRLVNDLHLPPDGPQRVVIGCAALAKEATEREKEMLCRDIVPLEATTLISDSATAYHGASLGRPGVLIIAGTGSVVLARNEAGQLAQVGGWGHLVGDPGSAYWIASESIKAATAAADGAGPETALLGLICRWFQVETLPEILPIIYDACYTKERLAALAKFLSERVEPEDTVFREICNRAGAELARQASAALRAVHYSGPEIPLYLVGGVVEHDRLVRESLLQQMRKEFNVQLELPRLPPVLGAVVLGLTAAERPLSEESSTRLGEAYRARLGTE